MTSHAWLYFLPSPMHNMYLSKTLNLYIPPTVDLDLPSSSISPSYFPRSSRGESEDTYSTTTMPPLLSQDSQKRKAGHKKFRETCHPTYRGIRQRDSRKWVCEVRDPHKKNSRIWLGTYPSPELAARAYDVAALALKGEPAVLNFPDSAMLAPRAKSSSPQDIRLAALQATTTTLQTNLVEDVVYHDHEKDLEDSRRLFLDEEAIYNMPGLIDSMAEGMLLTPPALKRGISWANHDYQLDNDPTNSFIDLDYLW